MDHLNTNFELVENSSLYVYCFIGALVYILRQKMVQSELIRHKYIIVHSRT